MREEARKKGEENHDRLARKMEEEKIGKEIFSGIFLGGKHVAKNWEFFEQYKVRSVVNMTSEVPNYHSAKGSVKYVKYVVHFVYYIVLTPCFFRRVEVSDLPSENILKLFDGVTNTIHNLKQDGNVLIHCKEGILVIFLVLLPTKYKGKSRSPTISIAYAMKFLNMTLADAFDTIDKKAAIRINPGFQHQLMEYPRRHINF